MSGPSMRLLQGTLDVLILKVLADGADHGYGVTRRIREQTAGVLDIDDGALYQALHRMRKQGWIRGQWGVSDRGRRARFYETTDRGRKRLNEETTSWWRYSGAVNRILGPA
jgi:PadR family transcriptional regulator, regulatory protein PadR